jgi:3-methyladenine DNA glycosylase AlkD
MTASLARKGLRTCASTEKARILSSFFKTGPGEYGEGDIFIGVKVPEIRALAHTFHTLGRKEVISLLKSPVHEERLLALFILIKQYTCGTTAEKEKIIKLYLKHTSRINNWDLVDLSAPKLLGDHLKNKPRTLLDQLARSTNIWERRIAIVSTFAFIRTGEINDTFRIADMLLSDEEDLIHKAAGWMLREAGKKDRKALEDHLRPRYKKMPRTMLRYAIERFPRPLYKKYLEGKV